MIIFVIIFLVIIIWVIILVIINLGDDFLGDNKQIVIFDDDDDDDDDVADVADVADVDVDVVGLFDDDAVVLETEFFHGGVMNQHHH